MASVATVSAACPKATAHWFRNASQRRNIHPPWSQRRSLEACQKTSRGEVVAPAHALASDFMDLAEASGTGVGDVEAHITPTTHRGLVTTGDVQKGEVLVKVPLSACISYDDEKGITLPQSAWPRLTKAVEVAQETQQPPPWDILFALALVDANAGDGDPFTSQYTSSFLPQPRSLTVPFCQSESALKSLQHPRVAKAALERRTALENTFPDLSSLYLDGTETTPVQWGLACVRSRAFQLSDALFAQVPFCDLCNHSDRPNAMVRPMLDKDGSQENLSVALVAVEPIPEGSEVTISYTGVSGATNRRLLVQYGFVVPGNSHDRLDFELFDGYVGTTPLRGAPGAGLSLSRLQEFIGGPGFQDLMSGSDPAFLCAMKSIPTYSMDASEFPNGAQVLKDEKRMLDRLLDKLAQIEGDFQTSLGFDLDLQKQDDLSPWEQTALAYRIERKKLADGARRVFEMYDKIICKGTT